MTVTAVRLGGRREQPLLVLGPAAGTSDGSPSGVAALWGPVAERLADDFQVVGWDLPGHGTNRAVAGDAGDAGDETSVAGLARAVLEVVDDLQAGVTDGLELPAFHYAGVGVGGAVGVQLLLDAPARVASATLLGTAADDTAYAALPGSSAGLDLRTRLGAVAAPVLAVAGGPPGGTTSRLREIAEAVGDGRLVVLEDVVQLAPVEAPDAVAGLVRGHVLGEAAPRPDGASSEPPVSARAVSDRDGLTVAEVRAAGRAVRSEVLGEDHVDRATRAATDLTADFQDLITEHAWGTVWTRPGLDRRSRSMITLTALVAGGHHDELALHVRAARRNGLTVEEIREVLLHSAVYCGVPAANTAFRIAQQVLRELGED